MQRCALGWQDRNGFGNDGCEVEVPVACELYVDGKQNPLGQDGSQAHPFFTVRQALGVVQAGCVIHIAAGDYAGGLLIDKPGVVLRGEGAEKTRILADTETTRGPLPMGEPYAIEKPAPKPDAAIRIQAADAVLEGLTIWGGSPAVGGLPAERTLIRDAVIGGADMFFGRWATTDTPVGINLHTSPNVRIILSRVTHIGHTQYNYHGQEAPLSPFASYFGWPDSNTGSAGVLSEGASLRVLGSRVDDLSASPPCYSHTASNYSCANVSGGTVSGIITNSGLASGVMVVNAKPGEGNDPNTYDFAPPAADGALTPFSGVQTDWTDVDPFGHFLELTGCVGGKISGLTVPVRVSNSSGMDISSIQSQTTIARSALELSACASCSFANSTAGDVHIDGATSLSLNKDSTGPLVISASPGLTINAINASGELSVATSPGAAVMHSKLKTLKASGCNGCKFSDLECAHIEAPYTTVGKFEKPEPVTAVSIGGNDVTIEDLRIHDIGGAYSWSIQNSDLMGGISASTVGLALSGDGIKVNQLAIWDITWMPPWGGVGPGNSQNCTGLLASGKNTSINHATIVLDLAAYNGFVAIQPVSQFSGSISNSIMMINSSQTIPLGYPLDGSCFPTATITSSLFWNCTATASAGFINVDPLLDFSGAFPVPTCTASACSPAIDGGSGDFCSEPAPNGCKANIGYGGGTSLAVSKPGASTCGCP